MLAYVFLSFLVTLFANFSGFVDHVTIQSPIHVRACVCVCVCVCEIWYLASSTQNRLFIF